MEKEDLEVYLQYGRILDERDKIMAMLCRMYYVERKIDIMKKMKVNTPNKTVTDVFKMVELANKELNLNKDQKILHANGHCSNMYSKLLESINDPNYDKPLLVRKLRMMINFIQVLTLFGQLHAEWQRICKRIYHFRLLLC